MKVTFPLLFLNFLLYELIILYQNVINSGLPARTETDFQNLNLNNFESEEAIGSSYILTSPRSLKACRLANIKVRPDICFNFINLLLIQSIISACRITA